MHSGYESIFRSIPGNKNIVPLWLNTYIYITDAWFHRVFHSTVFLPNFMDCPWMSQQNDATPKQKVKKKTNQHSFAPNLPSYVYRLYDKQLANSLFNMSTMLSFVEKCVPTLYGILECIKINIPFLTNWQLVGENS